MRLLCRRESLRRYENLTNLEAVVGKQFTFEGLPLKFCAGHGAPVRAIALLDE